jgi:hypothetical protein
MVISSVLAYGGTSLPADAHVEIVAYAGSDSMIGVLVFALATFISIALIAIASRYITNKYVSTSKKGKIQKFILYEIINFATLFLFALVFSLVPKILDPSSPFKFIHFHWGILIAIAILAPIIRAIGFKLTPNWPEWEIFKKKGD